MKKNPKQSDLYKLQSYIMIFFWDKLDKACGSEMILISFLAYLVPKLVGREGKNA